MSKEELIKTIVKSNPTDYFIESHLLESAPRKGSFVRVIDDNDNDKVKLGLILENNFGLGMFEKFFRVEVYEMADSALMVYRRKYEKSLVSTISLTAKDVGKTQIEKPVDAFAETELSGDFLKIFEALNRTEMDKVKDKVKDAPASDGEKKFKYPEKKAEIKEEKKEETPKVEKLEVKKSKKKKEVNKSEYSVFIPEVKVEKPIEKIQEKPLEKSVDPEDDEDQEIQWIELK